MTFRIAILLLISFRALAQLPVVPIALQTSFGPSSVLPSGMVFWWKTNGLAAGSVPVWTDSIQGFTFTQTSAPSQPTRDIDGVQFSSQSFVATNMTEASWNFLLVFKFNSSASSQMVIGDSTTGGHIYVGITSSGSVYEGTLGGLAVTPIGALKYDFIGARTGVGAWKMYTNGISGWSGGASFNANTIISKVGQAGAGAWFFNGGIHEFIVWTNQPIWSAVTVSNVHWYATNGYPHTP